MHRAGHAIVFALSVAMAALPSASSTPEAHAQCLPGGVSGAAVGRVDASLLELLTPVISAQIPDHFDIPDTPYTVFECDPPFDPTVITPLGMSAEVWIRSMSSSFGDGVIALDAELDVALGGQLDMQVCALADAVCDTELLSEAVRVHAEVVPRVVDCAPRFELVALELTPDVERTTAAVSNCTYENLWDLIYEWFAESLLDLVAGELETWVADEIPPLLESFLAELLTDQLEAYGFVIRAAVEDVQVRPAAAVVTFAADLRPAGPPAACLPAGASLPDEDGPPAVEPDTDAVISVAVSEAMVRRAVRAAWLAGFLCYDSRDYDFDLSSPLDFMAPGVDVQGQVAALSVPSVTLAGGDGGAVVAEANDVRVDVALQVPGHAASTMTATTSVEIRGDVVIDPAYQSLVVDLHGAKPTGAVVSAPGTALSFSGDTLRSILETGLLPAYAHLIRAIPLLSTLFVTTPLAVRMDTVRVVQGQAEVDVELWPIDHADVTAPETVVAVPPPDPAWVDVPIELASHDDRTPTRFLRHMVLLDGEPWDEDPLSGTHLYLWELVHGPHRLSIQAVDLSGNADPTPELYDIFVDDLPPEVRVAGAPDGLTRESAVSLTFAAWDDTSPADALGLRYTLSVMQEGNLPDRVVREGETRQGATLRFDDLPEDVVLRVTVYATDEAGNEGEGAVAFVSDPNPTLGCRTHSGPASASALLGGLALVLLWGATTLRRRRRA